MSPYATKSPILFLIFNRPDTTKRVFNEIKAAKPSRLYIAADGPRKSHPNDALLCIEAQSIKQDIDWECKVETLFRTNNLGCKNAVSSAIDWFFEYEEEGIILEDDCLPAASFFKYCDTLLEKYRFDTRIRHITGCNLQFGKQWGDAKIFFSNQTYVWGWATWKRVWKDYDKDLARYNVDEVRSQFNKIFNDRFIVDTWVQIFTDVKSGKIDTWDYQLAITNYFNNSISVIPNVNLIKNIGFGADATHTVSDNNAYSDLQLENIDEITYPKYILPEKGADYDVFNRDFDLEKRWKRHNLLRRRFKRWLKSKL